MAVAILFTLSRDQNKKNSNLQDLVNVLSSKTVQVNCNVLKECILAIHLHYFALERLLF